MVRVLRGCVVEAAVIFAAFVAPAPPVFDVSDPYRVPSYAEARRMIEADSLTGVMITLGPKDPYAGSIYYHLRLDSGALPGWEDGSYWARRHWDGRLVMERFRYPLNLTPETPRPFPSGPASRSTPATGVLNAVGASTSSAVGTGTVRILTRAPRVIAGATNVVPCRT